MLLSFKRVVPRALWLFLGRCRLRISHAVNITYLARLLSFYNAHLVQIGAGASSLDQRMPHPEGFHYMVSRLRKSYKGHISLYEPNPANLSKLTDSWCKCYFNVSIYREAVSLNEVGSLKFFYHDDDAPHFQCSSIDPDHVLRHHPQASFHDLRTFIACSSTLEMILSRELNLNNTLLFLALDVEGLDFSICAQIFKSDYLSQILGFSVEILNMSNDEYSQLCQLALANGFCNVGVGLDFHCWDRLFIRTTYSRCSPLLSFLAKTLLVDHKPTLR